MKTIIIIVLIGISQQTQIVLTQNRCQCIQITYQNDCNLRDDCLWIDSQCQKKPAISNIITPQYCQTVKQCTNTWGCQFVDGQCTFFTTCSAFIFRTHQLCGGISAQCTTNGQQCIQKRDCTTYDKPTCQQGMGLIGKCKWIDKCYNPVCSDETFKTDAECSNFIPGCISNGRYCLEKLLPCNQYQGNEWICNLMIGIDGKCNGSKSLQCKARQCSESPVFDTDLSCSKYQTGCITNGVQCVQQLQSCTSYQGNCLKYKGIEGPCNFSNTPFCKVLACSDFTTDCAKYGCFDIGGKCATSKLLCSQYQQQYCQSLVGSDGNCKLDVNNNCIAKLCEDAPISYNTDQQCALFQTGCITSGLGCVKALKLCSEYSGVPSTCSKYIGSDGICTSQPGNGPQNCSVRDCSLAPTSIATQQYQCSQYSHNCVSDGYKCTSWQSCELTTLDVSCRDRKTCVWGQSCVDNSCTSQYNTLLCAQHSNCFWTGTSCVDKLCSHAPITHTNDLLCQTWISTCKTNGFGCVSPQDQCQAYFGNQFNCSQFISSQGRCWNASNHQIGPCLQLNCSLAACAASVCLQSECQAYNQYCDFGGNQKCVNINESCNKYYGNQQFCSTKTSISGQKCNQDAGVTGTCRDQKCQDAPLTNITDEQCNTFQSGCVFGGYYCVKPGQYCSDWYGSQSECKALTINNVQCSRYSNLCRDQLCSDIQTPSIVNCQASKICYFDGTNCQTPNNCNQYDVSTATDKALACQQLLSNGNNCVYDSGNNCSNSNNCEKYTSGCTSIKVNGKYCLAGTTNCLNPLCKDQYICNSNCKFDGNVCLDIITDCTYPTTSTDNITKLFYCNRLGCGYKSGETKCSLQDCSGLPNATQDEDCLRYNSLCHYYGTPQCKLKISTCADLDLTPFTADLDKIYFCRSKQCQLSFNNKCVDIPATRCSGQNVSYLADNVSKTTFCNLLGCKYTNGQNSCADNSNTGTDCSGFLTLGTNDRDRQYSCSIQTSTSTCGYNPTTSSKCILPNQQCFNYYVYGYGYEEKLYYCQQMIDQDSKKCLFVNGIRCTSFSQCTDILDATICLTYGCQFTNNVCKSQQLLECSLIQPFDPQNLTLELQKSQFKQDYCQRYKGSCTYLSNQQSCSTQQCIGQAGTIEYCTSIGCQFDGQFCQKSVTCESIYMYFKDGEDADQVSKKVCSQVPYCVGGNGSSCRYYCQSIFAIGKNSIEKQTFCQSKSEGPIQCTYVLNDIFCSPFTCSRINFALTQDDCHSAKNTCYLDTNKHPCQNKVCSENITATTDKDCDDFMDGCVTSQLGCIASDESCSKIVSPNNDYCLQVSNGRCIHDINYPYCLNNSCQAVNVYDTIGAIYQNAANCPKWRPNCFFYQGQCVAIQPCKNYIGNQFTCPQYQSTDGPCVGIDIETNCVASQCSDAPNTLTTDDQCKQFKPTCVTNGYGCIEKLAFRCKQALTQDVCQLNSCKWVHSCYTVKTCDQYSLYGQSMCNNQTNCFWDKNTVVCRIKQCKDLPSSYTTDLQCSQFDKTCVTTKAGCVTKSTCSSYPFQFCNGATSTDAEGKCIWSSGCRPIKCEDNQTGTNDSICDLWLKGCVSNGKSCINKSTCDQLQQISCIVDSQQNQCLWVNGKCQQYSECTSLIFTTYEQCQALSKFCTTDGSKCIGLSLCQYYNQGSCLFGVDGKCAWAQDLRTCSLFQNCNNYKGNTLEKCQQYNSSCIFDGLGCVAKAECSTYKLNNQLCIAGGTNGKCIYEIDKGCRSFQCTDLKGDIVTYEGCNKQLSTCTTNGTNCISLTDCLYYTQQSCIQGLKGRCRFDNNICRYEACSDYQGDLNFCRQLKLISPCISNGTQCIQKGNCSTYPDKASCLIGGLDGDCVFTTKCSLMTQCADANKDIDSCQRQPYCRFFGNQTDTYCVPATCQNLQNGNLCFPVQNFNRTQYNVCQLINGTCSAAQAEQLDQSSCFLNTAQTYTWNSVNKTCSSCELLSYLPNQTNDTNQTIILYDMVLMINILYIII